MENQEVKDSIIEKTKAVIVDVLCVEPEIVVPDAKLKDLGADSLDVMNLVGKLEEEFSISINEDFGEKMETVQDMYQIVSDRVAK